MDQLPCSVCWRVAPADCLGGRIECSTCKSFIHRGCAHMDTKRLDEWNKGGLLFTCPQCALLNYEDFNFAASLSRLHSALQQPDPEIRIRQAAASELLALDTYGIRLDLRITTPNRGPVDVISREIMRKFHPGMTDHYTPLYVFGDGNCLYRAISRAMYGHEDAHEHIRLLTALEIIEHPHFYDFEAQPCKDQLADPNILVDPYPLILESACKLGGWGELLHIYAASAALALVIESYCPPLLIAEVQQLYRKVVGRGILTAPTPIHIMWTMMTVPQSPLHFRPNHFVALMNKDEQTQDPEPTQDPDSQDSLYSPYTTANNTFGGFDVNEVPTTPTTEAFNIEIPVNSSTQPEEPVLRRPMPQEMEDDRTVRYTLVRGGSKKGGNILTDSLGYTYCVKRITPISTQWRCSRHNYHCLGRVTQSGGHYKRGESAHNHPGKPGNELYHRSRSMVKELAVTQRFCSSAQLVEQVMLSMNVGEEEVDLPNPNNLTRVANRARAGLQPKHPQDLNFEVIERHIPPEFLQADIRHRDQRYLLMATTTQLLHLRMAKVWYIDATFKVVREPFMQLMSIHSFLRTDGATKQVPLAFVLMSRRRKSDYRAVLDKLLEVAGETSVEEVVCDFEQAIWGAVHLVLPDVHIHGCSFHWSQAVFRKIKELGLSTAYWRQPAIRDYLRHLMALVYMPEDHIGPSFEYLVTQCPPNNESMLKLLDYFGRNWIRSKSRPPSSWSAFKRSIRTNNDVEGWHYRLNKKSNKHRLNMYELIEVLHKEASLLPIQVQLLSQKKIYRHRRALDRSKEIALKDLWDNYTGPSRTMNTETYWTAVAELVGFTGLEECVD